MKELSNFEKNQERLKLKETPFVDPNVLYQSNAPPTLEQIEAQNAMVFPDEQQMMTESDGPNDVESETQETAPPEAQEMGDSTEDAQ